VAEDPPFPRLDLISCRNTLIYFTTPLRDQVLSLFRFALQPGGLLLLGSSESLSNRTAGFLAAQPEHRLYLRSSEAESLARLLPPLGSPALRRPLAFGSLGSSRIAILRDSVPEQHMALLEGLLRLLGPPCLVLDENHDLVEVLGDVTRFCRLPEGRMSASAHAFLIPALQAPARALLLAARADDEPLSSAPIRLEGLEQAVRLEVRPLRLGERTLLILAFLREVPPPGAAEVSLSLERDGAFDREIERLERDLLASQDSLRRSLVELEGANEELEASSEELQASSEELQSSNEELEASNEELQASNEALASLNQQLRSRTEELQQLNSDLENIQLCLSQGMVIVDRELRVTRFTPLAVRVFALVESDLGRPLLAVPTTVPLPGLREALGDVVAGEPGRSFEANGGELSYLVQVLPYQNRPGHCQGAIVTLTEVSELVRLRRVSEEALNDFTRVTDALEEVIWKRDVSLERLLYVSRRVETLTGWSSEELCARPELLEEAVEPEDRARVEQVRAAGAALGWSMRYRLRRRDGTVLWVRERANAVSPEPPAAGFVVGTLVDVTELQALEEQARRTSAVFESVFHTGFFGVAILDRQQRLLLANECLAALVGLDPQTLAGIPTRLLAAESHLQALAEGIREALAAPDLPVGLTLLLRGGAGGAAWVTAEIRALPQGAGEAVAVLIVQDVTSLRETTLRLESQARIDAATGLLNRASFCEALERELARAAREETPLALAWVDLDRFKEVNDRYGHEAGDRVLRTVAERLSSVIRRGKDYVGRLGGDEFGVILIGYDDLHELDRILERAMRELLRPIPGAGVELSVGASVGLALHPRDATGLEELLHAADTAMYGAKEGGGNGFRYFQPEMNLAAEQRRSLWQSLSRSIDAEEFELHYQPILTAAGDRVWGLEALLRWRREGVPVAAESFIGFAEESGLIRRIGPLTLRLLRLDMQRLIAAGRQALPLCINMTLRQLEDSRLIEVLDLSPTPSGMAGIVVEVTESVLLPEHLRARETLQTLVAQGARLCVDNYGSGYSSLQELQQLGPSLIKLAPALLVASAEARDRLLRPAVGLVHALGGLAVLGGVEHADQRELAKAVGADLQQGRALALPMPLEELLEWLAGPLRSPLDPPP
jgi:two-component system CheB/CheR fusion protein